MEPDRIYKSGMIFGTRGQVIPAGGELVLGQSSRKPSGYFDTKVAYVGELGFVNIWSRLLSRREIKAISQDCIFNTCGDTIEWADFRSGTRGRMRMRWPSQIMGTSVNLYFISTEIILLRLILSRNETHTLRRKNSWTVHVHQLTYLNKNTLYI